MKKFLVLFGIFFLCPIAAFGAATPETGEGQPSTYDLGEVVISTPGKGVEAVGTTYRVTAADIEQSGARSLDEALDLLPGVYVRIGGSGTPRIDIRGFRTRHVTLLLDGIPFNETYDGQFDPTTIPVEYIQEIKIITGGGSVLYGAGGNGGTINIITKKGKTGTRGMMSGEIGSENARNANFSLASGTDKLSLFVGASSRQKDGFPLSDDFDATADEDGDRRENSDSERISFSGNLFYTPSEETVMGFSFNHIQGKNGVPPTTNYDANDSFSKQPKYERVDDANSNAFQASMDHRFDMPLRLRGWVYFNQQDLLENGYDGPDYDTQTTKNAYALDSTSKVKGINLQAVCDFDGMGKATVGMSGETQEWVVAGFEKSKPVADARKDRLYSVAAEYEASPVQNLNLVAGYGHHFQNKSEGKSESAGAYLLGAAYDILETTQVKASYAKKVRFPSIRQLYSPKDGNTALAPEKSFHYEVGITQELPGDTRLSATVFNIDAEDFIEKPENGNGYLNYEEYRFRGFEIAADSKPIQGAAFRASYAFLDSEDKSTGSTKDELQHRPKHKYGLEAVYRLSCGFAAHMDFMRVQDQVFYDKNGNSKALNDYSVVNIKVSQDLAEKALTLYAGCDNLMDENYEQSYGLPQAGRALYGGMTWRF